MSLEDKLKEIKNRCEAATEGPWEPAYKTVISRNHRHLEFDIPDSESDAQFIAHARTDLPMLLEMVETIMDLIEKSAAEEYKLFIFNNIESIAEKYSESKD